MKRRVLCAALSLVMAVAAAGCDIGEPTSDTRAIPSVVISEISDTSSSESDILSSSSSTSSTSSSTTEKTSSSKSAISSSTSSTSIEKSASAVSEGTEYVLNNNTKKFHRPRCSSVKDIKPSNRSDVTATREEIIAKGYEPCKKCKP